MFCQRCEDELRESLHSLRHAFGLHGFQGASIRGSVAKSMFNVTLSHGQEQRTVECHPPASL